MCVATSLIVAGIAAGGTLAGAKLQSNAANKASKTQAEAADKALAFQKEQYAQQRQDFNPYQQASGAALQHLGTAATAPPVNFQPGQPRQLGLPQGVPPPAMGVQTSGGPVSASLQGTPGGGLGSAPPAPPIAPQGGASAALWTLQAPDGTTAQYPADVAQQYITKGARRVA